MAIEVVTPPAEEPVTLTRARSEIGLVHNADDSMVTDKIIEARQHIEQMLSRALITQTWRLSLDQFCDEIVLPGGRVQSITSVKYTDKDGVEQTLAASAYQADIISNRPRIRRVPGTSWPETENTFNAVRIEYVVGYGAASAVPGGIVAALLLMVGDLYANREAQVTGTTIQDNKTVSRLLWPHRSVEV